MTMPLYRYSAYTSAGRVEHGEIEARTAEEAASTLTRRGLTPFETTLAPVGTRKAQIGGGATLRLKELAPFMREIATLLQAELPLDEALRILAERRAAPRARRLAQALGDDVRTGLPLSEAIERHASGAPPYVASLVRAGEVRGSLGATLGEIAKLLETRAEIESRVRSALTYPLLLLIIAIGTLSIVIVYLFPALLRMFEDAGTSPPLVLAFVRDSAGFLDAHGLPLSMMLLAFVLAVGVWLRRRGVREEVDRFLSSLPVIGIIRRDTATAIFSRTLGLLIRNGVPLVGALEVTARAVPSAALAVAISEASALVKEGARLSDGLAKGGVLPDVAVRLIAIGEEAGKLDSMLLHSADMFERDTARRVEQAVTMLSPAITVVVGLLIGGIVLSVMEAILSVNSLAIR